MDCCLFSLLQREYLWLAINMLANSPKISDITKGDILQLYFCHSEGWYDKTAVMWISAVNGIL